MIVKTDGIVLHSFKYGESKIIVDMFSREHGRISFIVSMPKSAKGALKKQYFQPFTLLSLVFDYRQQQQLQKLTDATILTPMPSLLTDPTKLSICLFLSEFLYHALKGEQANSTLFAYIQSSLQWLDSSEQHYANFHLVFLMRLSRFLGFYPNLDDVSPDQYFDLRAASFCAHPPIHRDFLMPNEAALVHLMMRMDFPTMHLFKLNRQQRNRCIEVALQFYRLHLPSFPDLHSLSVLQELWD